MPGEYYNLDKIKSDIKELNHLTPKDESRISQVVELDVSLSNAYMKYASDMSEGRVNPHKLGMVWQDYPVKSGPDVVKYLEKSIENRDIAESLENLKPMKAQYSLLTDAYNQIRNVKSEGGWPLPGYFSKMEENDTANEVISLKKYLLATGDLNNKDTDYIQSTVFDKELTECCFPFPTPPWIETGWNSR